MKKDTKENKKIEDSKKVKEEVTLCEKLLIMRLKKSKEKNYFLSED